MLLDQDHLRVTLRNIVTECRCGLHPWEQYPERPTRLVINVDLYLGVEAGPLPERDITSYDDIRAFIRTFPVAPSHAAAGVARERADGRVLQTKNVQACRVSLMKPDIFNEVEGAGIEVFRTRDSWEARDMTGARPWSPALDGASARTSRSIWPEWASMCSSTFAAPLKPARTVVAEIVDRREGRRASSHAS